MPSDNTARDDFDLLVSTLAPDIQDLYHDAKHTRTEAAFRNRQFVVYNHDNGLEIEDVLTIGNFEVDDETGPWTHVHSRKRGESKIIDYKPVQLWDYEILAWLPLHYNLRLRFHIDRRDPRQGKFSYPIVIKTMSRFNLREPEVDYMEPLSAFFREFGQQKFPF